MSRSVRLTLVALLSLYPVTGCGSKDGDDGGEAGVPGGGSAGTPSIELGGRPGYGGASAGGSGGSGARPTGGVGGEGGDGTTGGAPVGGASVGGGTSSGGGPVTGGSGPASGGTGGDPATGIVPIGGICANTSNCDPSSGPVTCCEGTCLLSEDCTPTGYLPCDSAASCGAYGGGKVCCEVNTGGTLTRFCTKPSACNGTELP